MRSGYKNKLSNVGPLSNVHQTAGSGLTLLKIYTFSQQMFGILILKSSVANPDPVSIAFLPWDPRSWINVPNHISESLVRKLVLLCSFFIVYESTLTFLFFPSSPILCGINRLRGTVDLWIARNLGVLINDHMNSHQSWIKI